MSGRVVLANPKAVRENTRREDRPDRRQDAGAVADGRVPGRGVGAG
jgi:hypothetical protein